MRAVLLTAKMPPELTLPRQKILATAKKIRGSDVIYSKPYIIITIKRAFMLAISLNQKTRGSFNDLYIGDC